MKRTRLRPVSKKRAALNRKYAEQREAFLASHPVCGRCKVERSTQVHHMRGRVGSLLLDERFWLAVGADCHRYITEHPAEAYESGLSLRRVS